MSDIFFKYLFDYKELKTQLFKACINGDEDIVRSLLESIPDMVNTEVTYVSPIVKLVDDHVIGFSPFHFAAEHGNLRLCRLLVDFKADVNKVSGMGTPLHIAMLYDHEDVFDFLIQHNADINAKVETENAFHILFFVGSNHEDYVIKKWAHKLVEEGCNINHPSFGGLRPLKLAPEYLVTFLKENGAIY